MSTGGEVANALVCKTSIRGFNSLPVLQIINSYIRNLNPRQPIVTHDKLRLPQQGR